MGLSVAATWPADCVCTGQVPLGTVGLPPRGEGNSCQYTDGLQRPTRPRVGQRRHSERAQYAFQAAIVCRVIMPASVSACVSVSLQVGPVDVSMNGSFQVTG